MRKLLLCVVLLASLSSPARAESEAPFHLVGPITEEIVPHFQEWIKVTKAPVVIIDSQGGLMDASIEIRNAIKAHGKVRCQVRGMAYSGAFAILGGCAVREMTKASKLMTHEPKVVVRNPVDRLELWELFMHVMKATQDWNALCRERLKMTAAEYEAKVKGTDWFLDWQEALKVTAVDRVLN